MARQISSSPITNPVRVDELKRGKPFLLPNVLDPRKFGMLGIFRHIYQLCAEQIERRGLEGIIALAVALHSKRDGRERVRYSLPVIVNGLKNDSTAQKFEKRTKEGEFFEFDWNKSLTALMISTITGLGSEEDHRSECEEDIENSRGTYWMTCKSPRQRYKGIWQTSSSKEVKQSIIHPVVLEAFSEVPEENGGKEEIWYGVAAAFAIDLVEELDSERVDEIELLFRNLSFMLYSSYLAYCTHLDFYNDMYWNKKEKWVATGQIMSPAYLENLERAILEERLNGEDWDYLARHGSIARADRLLLLYCDGNGIKKLNDKHSHKVGNELIKLYGACLFLAIEEISGPRVELSSTESHVGSRQGVRGGVVIRWGGDEFVVIIDISSSDEDGGKKGSKVPSGLEFERAVIAKYVESVRNVLSDGLSALENALQKSGDETVKRAGKVGNDLVGMCGIAIGWSAWSRGDSAGDSFRQSWSSVAESAMYVCKYAMEFYDFIGEKTRRDEGEESGKMRLASVVGHVELPRIQERLAKRLGVKINGKGVEDE